MNTKQKKKTLAELTSNQMYGAMNRRFDKRVRLLRRFGFVYKAVEGVGMLTRNLRGKPQVISASMLLAAPNRIFRELVLRSNLVRPILL